MVSNSLRQFLQSLCCSSQWDYAVFWRLQQHQSQMLLTWEDGSFNISRPSETTEDINDSFYLNWSNKEFSSCQSGNQNGDLTDSAIGIMMAEMSSFYYVFGKGFVGEVASSENPSWIFADRIIAGGCNFNVISEYPDELIHQFVAGIKTILLVPLVPFGVLQLGSTDKVAEDAELVTYVKIKFDMHQQFPGDFAAFGLEGKVYVQPPEAEYAYIQSLGELPGTAINKTDEEVPDTTDVGYQKIPNTNEMMPMVQNLCEIYQKDMSNVTDTGNESKSMPSVGISDVTEPFMYSTFENSESEMTHNILRSSCIEEELEAISFGNYEMKHNSKILKSHSNEGTMGWPFQKEDSDDTICKSENRILRFPSECELHKALGTVLWAPADLNFLQPGESSDRSLLSKQDIVHDVHPPALYSVRESAKENKVEYLLEAVVGNASSSSDDSSSNKSQSTSSSLKASPGRFDSPQLEQGPFAGNNHVAWSSVTSEFSKDSKLHIPTSASSLGYMINALIEHHGSSKARPTEKSRPTGAAKRRARSGENQKPRPRDRQLIQERIKELRELVPSGSKCSIDGLLDRTIKHMQFLKRVTDQADKIKQHLSKEGFDQKCIIPQPIKNCYQNGTSWALELECEQQTCPIVVKDLEHPGHMLIEMLCHDNSRFLEIADVIYRLELTILKGVMERRSDGNTWAHFIVEASGKFHRLDIFWPLMQLLQQNRTQIASKI